MFENEQVDNIIHAGLILIVYMFCVILLYFVLSSPVDAIFDAIETGSVGTDAETYMTEFLPNIEWAVRVVFAIALAIPITWFIFWIFSREPDVTIIRRR